MLTKFIFISALAGVSASLLATDTITPPTSVGPSVGAKKVNTNLFVPQINPVTSSRTMKREHNLTPNYDPSVANDLVANTSLVGNRSSFAGRTFFNGISGRFVSPPDPDIAVGPTSIVEVVNTEIAFYTKKGVKTFQQPAEIFFAAQNPDEIVSDTKVIYDAVAKRFVFIVLSIQEMGGTTRSAILIATSDDSNPTGSWDTFRVDVKQTVNNVDFLFDYPGFGFTKDTIAISGAMFGFTGGYNGIQILAFDKATLYSGTATPTKFTTPGFTLQLSKSHDSVAGAVYGMQTLGPTSMGLSAITRTPSNGFLFTQTTVPIPAWAFAQRDIAGPGTSQPVDTIPDGRIFTAAVRNGKMVGGHVIAASPSNSLPAARWYEFRLNSWPLAVGSAPSLIQSGTLKATGGHGYTFPALNYDINGNIGMTFSKIGPSTPGQQMVTSRKTTDPLGTMGAPVVAASSLGDTYRLGDRWGDYFDVEVDPIDNRTMWAVGMGANVDGGWITFINSFKVSIEESDLTASRPLSADVVTGTQVLGNLASLYALDNSMYGMRTQPVIGLGQTSAFRSIYQMPFVNIDVLRMYMRVSGPSGTSIGIFIKDVNTGEFVEFQSFGMTTRTVDRVIEFSQAQRARFVASNGSVETIIRAVQPVRSGRMPSLFSWSVDRAIFASSELPPEEPN
jgi:hypothetical protein